MKVPNKVLDIVTRLANQMEVTTEERNVVIAWAREGSEKRAQMAAEKKSEES
jgi:hypothetical protein